MTIGPINRAYVQAAPEMKLAQRSSFGGILETAGKVIDVVKDLPSFGKDYMSVATQVEALVSADQAALGDKASKLTEIGSRIKHSWPMLKFMGERLIMPIGGLIAAL